MNFDLFAVEGVPCVRRGVVDSVGGGGESCGPGEPLIASTPLCVSTPRRTPPSRRRTANLTRHALLLGVGVLLALLTVRAALRFHSEYNILAEVRREGLIYWRTVCDEGRSRPPNSYDQCTRAKTDAHQFTSLLALERVLLLALNDMNPFADCVPGTSCSFVWMKASEAVIRLMDSLASNLTLALGLLSYVAYANVGPLIGAWLCRRRKQEQQQQPRSK